MPYVDDANLKGYWRKEETSGTRYDETPNDNDLTDYNTVGSSTTRQEGERSADFELANDERLAISDAAQTGLDITGNITLGAWVRPESLPNTWHTIISKWDGGEPYSYTLTIGDYNVGTMRAWLLLSSNGSDTDGYAIGNTVLSATNWYHIVGVYDGVDCRIYINGALDSGTYNPLAYTDDIYDGTGAVTLGATADNENYFDGLIDAGAIWSRALSAAEVSDWYNYGIQGPPQVMIF